jgi:hypothetical protein
MEDQMREPGQLILLFGDESVHRRRRVAQRRPGSLGDLRRQHRPVEVEITVPQRFPAVPVVHSDRSDGHFAGDVAPPRYWLNEAPAESCPPWISCRWPALMMP